ncbi:MAG: helix-turn-helix transcriptional regulator [Parafilimonas terrae]|nr:helix-turn-helix transcriptional regulator [Parafilimonas terrae]
MIDPGRAPGEVLSAAENEGADDVALYRVRYAAASHVFGISAHHLVVVNVGAAVPAACRIGSAELDHVSGPGNVVVIPAEVPWSAVIPRSAEHVIIALPRERWAVAAAQARVRVEPIRSRMRSQDPDLVSLVLEMAASAGPASADDLAWHALADAFLDQICGSFSTADRVRQGGVLAPEVLRRLNDYLRPRLDQSLLVDSLADVAGQGRSHFPRVFRRTVGMSPYQYVMRLRLRRARTLIGRQLPLAEVALASGFADQSHLNHWVRRIYGTTPGRLATGRDPGTEDGAWGSGPARTGP